MKQFYKELKLIKCPHCKLIGFLILHGYLYGYDEKIYNRYAFDIKKIKFLEPNQSNDELFYNEKKRYVKKDNTFSFKSRRYEAPCDLRDKKVNIRFDRNSFNKIIVYYKNHRMGEAKKLDLISNGILRRGGSK